MKNARDYLVERIQAEKTAFLKVLKAVPEGSLDYRPHPKSTSARDLVWLLACELGDAVELIETGQAEYRPGEAPAKMAPMIELYEKNSAALEASSRG